MRGIQVAICCIVCSSFTAEPNKTVLLLPDASKGSAPSSPSKSRAWKIKGFDKDGITIVDRDTKVRKKNGTNISDDETNEPSSKESD